MLSVHPFSPTACIRISNTISLLPNDVEAEVERLWQAEQQRRGKPLFNGSILSAIEISSHEIIGRIVEYRHYVAQRARPELFDVLKVRPVAVSGLLECADGVVFGRRAGSMTQDAGFWELVPSGGIDTSKADERTDVNYRAQILTELHEEIGINSDSVLSIRSFCLVEDIDSHVIDIGIAMVSPLSTDEVLRIHREAATKEYDELRVVPFADIDGFIQVEAMQLVGVSAMLIQHFQDHDIGVGDDEELSAMLAGDVFK